MKYTENYNLIKPEENNIVDVDDINSNMDIIDSKLKDIEENAGAKLGETEDTAFPGDKGKIAYDHSQKITGNPHKVTLADVGGAAANHTHSLDSLGAAKESDLKDHIKSGISSESGAHNFRWYDDMLQFWDGTAWIEIETGGGGIPPGDVSGISIEPDNASLKICFTEPDDNIWAGTKVVRKAGAYPDNVKDGTVVLDNRTKNAYKDTPFVDSGLTNGTTYYYQFFTYSATSAVNSNVVNRGTGSPVAYKIMGVQIDLSNSNPETCVTYTDDALSMTPKSEEWDKFFGHKPCLFKNGAVVGYLNPNNFAQFEDGSAADITSGSAGDVMIEFPRRGLTMSTSGNILTIKMTANPDDTNFKYYAHTRGTAKRDYFYLGAYKGYVQSNALRSLSGKTPTATQTIGTFRTQAQANGTGYEQSGFYQLVFRQCMYILKYKNLDSQTALGYGNANRSSLINTGGTNLKGMDFGETTGKLQMKLFGLEDFWGNIWEFIDGVVTDDSWNILTGTSNFNDTGSGYNGYSSGLLANEIGWMRVPQGTSESGFILKTAGGSQTTYFCDGTSLSSGRIAYFGDYWDNATSAGVFCLLLSYAASYSFAGIGARLMYL